MKICARTKYYFDVVCVKSVFVLIVELILIMYQFQTPFF